MAQLVERITETKDLDKFLLDSKVGLHMGDEDHGLGVLLAGEYGLSVTHLDLENPADPSKPKREEVPFGQGGIHGILASANGDGTVGTDAQRDRIRKWMEQPVLDPDGNPYVATAGLATYFSGDGDRYDGIWKAAQAESVSYTHLTLPTKA